ncbi:hypothetical protein Hanom_Chr05g00468221 [Helianthus anomalus]
MVIALWHCETDELIAMDPYKLSIRIKALSLQASKKNPVEVPKPIHKAERKLEHLNELFLQLAGALGNF